MPPKNVFSIRLLRHGQSTGNAQGVFQGQADYPLDETGLRQAQALAVRWQAEKVVFDKIIASPLKRARQTAETIAAALGNPKIEFDDNWMERNNGAISGLTSEQAREKFPMPPLFNPYTAYGQDGESNWLLYLRAGKAIDDLLRRPPARYLIVSHGGILNMALYAILGIPLQAGFSGARFRFQNSAFSTLTYFADRHQWYLEGLNDHVHWKDEE